MSLDTEPGDGGRAGVPPADVDRLAEQVAAADGLRLRGVMAVAPLGRIPCLRSRNSPRIASSVRRIDPSATWISAGMSGDLEAAVESGATHVRIGSAVLGSRPPRR